MLVSSYRYIPTTTETWVDKKFKKHNYKSFRERYNSLDKVGCFKPTVSFVCLSLLYIPLWSIHTHVKKLCLGG